MKKATSIALAILLVWTSAAFASGDGSTDRPSELPESRRTTPLMKGKVSPYTGLLVGEKRFSELLKAEIEFEDLKVKLSIERRAAKAVEKTYKAAMKELVKPIPWYMKPWFNKLIGAVIGAGLVLLSTWVGIKIVEAGR
jgi:hypothetical protein